MTLMRLISFPKGHFITEKTITGPFFFEIVRPRVQKEISRKVTPDPQLPALLNALVNAEEKR